MIDLGYNDPPVRPAVEGRYELPNKGMYFTIGRDHVAETAWKLLRRNRMLGCDIETFGLGNDRFRIKTVTFADDVDAVILDPRDPYQADICIKMMSELSGIVMHNSGYDAPSLYQRDLMTEEDVNKIIDTIVASRQAVPGESWSNKHDLESLAKEYFGITIEKKRSKDDYYKIDIHMISFIHGAAYDALYTFKLLPKLLAKVRKRYEIPPPTKGMELTPEYKTYIINREQYVNQILLQRMKKGLCVDLDEVDAYEIKVRPQENKCELLMKSHGMTKYTNGNQLIAILERDNAIPPGYPRTENTKVPSTKEEDLKLLQHPLAIAYSKYSKIQKVKQYLDTIADESYRTGRVFATTKILAAGTGRISMAGPALQQFTPLARPVIVAEEGGSLSSIDWSQVEPTILCYVADDKTSLDRYEQGGEDFYEIVGAICGIERKIAKVTLLALMYGRGVTSLSLALGVSYSTALEYRNRIFAAMPDVETFINGMKAVGKTGYVHTLFGRVLDVPKWKGDIKAYTAINYFVQGSAYDFLAESFLRINEAGLGEGIYFSIHDEIVVDTEYADDIAAIMRTPPKRFADMLDRVPLLKADPITLGRHWQKL